MKELELTLRLQDIHDLFTPPALTPFSDGYHEHSLKAGVEHILGELYAHPSAGRINLTVLLPEDRITPGLHRETQQAIERYANARITAARHEVNKVWYQGTRALPVAVVGLLILIQGSLPLMEARSYWLQVLGNGLNVAGWVAVWFPLDALIFQVWLSRQEKRAYRVLQNTQVAVRPDA
ncbi:MAG: hypothetical protein ACT4PY_09565 [Armatimonadota bacterium]